MRPALFALMVLAAAPGGEVAVRGLAARLTSRPPQKLSELERATGALRRDPERDWIGLMRDSPAPGVRFLAARFAVDLLREKPEKVPDPALAEYTLGFEEGRDALLQELRRRFGPGVRYAGPRGPVLGFGPFYVDADPDRAPTVTWYAREPDFVVHGAPYSPEARTEWLDGLPASLAGAMSAGELARIARTLPAAAGARFEAVPGGGRFEFRPPVPAAELARVFGWKRAFVLADDAHWQTWSVAVMLRALEEAPQPLIQTERPRQGRWRLEARVEKPPTGNPDARVRMSAAYDLEKHPSLVRFLTVAGP